MKILVVGCGVIGTIYGWSLSKAGHSVVHLVRGNKINSLKNGIELDVYDLRQANELSVTDQTSLALLNKMGSGSTAKQFDSAIVPKDVDDRYPQTKLTVYYPNVIDEINESDFELVIIPTKHYQLLAALKKVYPKLTEATYLIFCAIWGELDGIDKIIPRSHYVLGYPASSGGYDDNGTMVINVRKDYRIGKVDGTQEKLIDKVITVFSSAGFVPDRKTNMLEWLWVHHAINAGTIGALMFAGGFNADILNSPDFSKPFYHATLDAINVLKAKGVNIESYPDTQAFLKQTPEQILDCYRKLFIDTPIGRRSMESGHHKHSFDEMRQYYLDVLHTGKQLGVSMPTLSSFEQKIASL